MSEYAVVYSLSTDFGGTFWSDNFADEIRSSGITRALARVDTLNDDITVVFNGVDALSQTDSDLLDALVAAHDSTVPDTSGLPKSSEGWLKVVTNKNYELPSITAVSINYANKRTWWFGSTRTTLETVTPDGTGTIYTLAAGGEIINIYELTEGDVQTAWYDPNGYRVRVYKNSSELVGREYGFESGSTAANTTGSHADAYTVNYQTGVVTFDNSQTGHTIEVSYSKPVTGNFKLSPPTGKLWRIHHIELQFGVDHTAWTNPMQFVMGVNYSATGNNDVAAKTYTYRGIADILNKANLGTAVPACGELTADLYQIPFDYISGFNLVPRGTTPDPAKNTVNYLELKMKYDLTIPGTQLATASFYIFEETLA